ncbi:alpha/beta hydrolase [Leifsonia poae]|uniref:alpha/beta hydrolase n=1 Tax=Leifsonia poae TaxID=110933 RepID=UPI001CBE7CE9|nr:alpha/beta hydrolase [Leifsonia poae]
MTDSVTMPYPVPKSVSQEAQAILAAPVVRPTYPALGDTEDWLAHIRAADESILAVIPPVSEALNEDIRDVGGVQVFVHRSPSVREGGPVCLTMHPGGLINMGGEVCRRLGALSALSMEMEVWSVDYRMPPLYPFPAGWDDAVAVYRHLVERRDPKDVFVSGVSAGGNLAAATLLRATDESLPMPAALYLGTPQLDLTESGDSFQVNAHADRALASLEQVNLLYAAGHDLAHPYLSPLFGDVDDFPPTLLSTGTRDLFLSNTVRMHRKLRESGVRAELLVFEAMPHAGFSGATPEDIELSLEVIQFVAAHRS